MPKKELVLGKAGPSLLQASKALKIRPPALYVQEYSGDFAQWVKAKTIDQPEESMFSFRNDYADVSEASWQLSAAPMPPKDPSANFPGFLGSGPLQPPAQDQAKTFSVNWKALVPAQPPKGTTYYLRVVVKRGPAKSALVASNTVGLTVKKSTFQLKFTPSGLGQTVKQQHPDLYATPSMTVRIDLKELRIGNDNEGADEPYLFVAVVYVDGTTIDPFHMDTSTVRIDSPTKTHGNIHDEDASGEDLEENSIALIPAPTGHFERTITPIGLDLATDLEDPDGALGDAIRTTTAVYLVLVALEEDDTSTEAIDAARAAFLKALRSQIEAVIQTTTFAEIVAGDLPTFDADKMKAMETELRKKALGAAEDETFSPGWWTPALFPFLLDEADKDDVVGFAFRKFSYSDLLAAGPAGITFEATASAPDIEDWEGSYTIRGKIRRM